jgi:acyl-CoA synthetase (AMP-forming)/AMP-acid ligase II
MPGLELKLVPNGDRYEVRVRGPSVTPGYLGGQDPGATTFDDEGFYCTGDAATFIDPAEPSVGLRARGVHASGESFVRLQVATVRWSFTLFEARSINFATMVYSESMHVDCRLASSQLLGSRRATWPRKRRRQRRQRRQPRRKRSSRSTKTLSIRIASEVRYALCSTDRPQLSPTEYPRNKQSGRIIMQMAAA